MTEASRAVFLSYASQDAEAAQKICAALRSAGVEVWFDQSELRGGDAWDHQIRERIHDCRLFIALISSHTEVRDEGYFRREWKLAVDRTHDMLEKKAFLLPVVIDATPERGAAVPEKFHEVQWTRLPSGETPPEFVARVARLLAPESATAGTRQPAGSAVAATAANAMPVDKPRRAKLAWPVIAAVVLAAALAYILIYALWIGKRVAVSPPVTVPVAVPATTTAVAEKSIAVLPFADMSEKRDQEYFGDGMAEALSDLLVKIPELTVIGRTSAFQFKGHSEDLRAIGAKLGAAYIVEGSVRSAGSRIRVTAQLIDARSGAHVWSESYDRAIGDVLVLQDEMAAGIARALQLVVAADGRPPARAALNPEAYELYLRGRFAFDRGEFAGFKEAREDFDRALVLDPAFTQASEWLLIAYEDEWWDGEVSGNVALPRVRELAEGLLRRDPGSALAHAMLAWVHAYYDLDRSSLEREIDAVLASKTRNSVALYLTGYVASEIGRDDDAARLLREAIAIDPLSPDAYQALSGALGNAGDYIGEEKAARRSLEISPTFNGNHLNIGGALLARHELTAALHEMESETPVGGRDYGLALVESALGNRQASDAALGRFVRDYGEIFPCQVAEIYAYRGQNDLAFLWLDRSLRVHDSCGLGVERDRLLTKLHADARWDVLMERLRSGSKRSDQG